MVILLFWKANFNNLEYSFMIILRYINIMSDEDVFVSYITDDCSSLMKA